MDKREGRQFPPIRVTNEGDRRPVGVALHITLSVIPSLNRAVPGGVSVPLATDVVLPAPPPVTFALFLTVPPQPTAPIHVPNRTSLLPKATLNLHH